MSLLDAIAPHVNTDAVQSVASNVAPVTAGATSFAATFALAAGAPVPDSLPTWLPYLVSIVGPALIFVLNRLLGGWAARKRSLAASKNHRAKEMLADKDHTNDAAAHKLEDEADELDATADALDAAKK